MQQIPSRCEFELTAQCSTMQHQYTVTWLPNATNSVKERHLRWLPNATHYNNFKNLVHIVAFSMVRVVFYMWFLFMQVTFKNTSNCHICADREKDSFLIPCGHTFCFVCALHLHENDNHCPFCKLGTQSVGRLFLNWALKGQVKQNTKHKIFRSFFMIFVFSGFIIMTVFLPAKLFWLPWNIIYLLRKHLITSYRLCCKMYHVFIYIFQETKYFAQIIHT